MKHVLALLKPIRLTLIALGLGAFLVTIRVVDGMFSFLTTFAGREDLAEWWEIGVVAAIVAGFGGLVMAFIGGIIALMGHLAQDSPEPPEPSVPKSSHDEAIKGLVTVATNSVEEVSETVETTTE